jgi:anti-sigma regulatory factor (Ser/Thr protein kinase)
MTIDQEPGCGPGGGASVGWSFERSARSSGRARRLLRRQLNDWGVPESLAGTAELLLSELVTNALRHACKPPGRLITVHAEFAPGRLLRIEVADTSDAEPVVRPFAGPGPGPGPGPDSENESGRGLLLVDALATAWGTYPRKWIGKAVWITLSLDPAEYDDLGPGAGAVPVGGEHAGEPWRAMALWAGLGGSAGGAA